MIQQTWPSLFLQLYRSSRAMVAFVLRVTWYFVSSSPVRLNQYLSLSLPDFESTQEDMNAAWSPGDVVSDLASREKKAPKISEEQMQICEGTDSKKWFICWCAAHTETHVFCFLHDQQDHNHNRYNSNLHIYNMKVIQFQSNSKANRFTLLLQDKLNSFPMFCYQSASWFTNTGQGWRGNKGYILIEIEIFIL